jgi:hypothetical protein
MPSKSIENDDGKEENENVDDDLALVKCGASDLRAAVTDSAVTALVKDDTAFSSPNRRPKPRYS